MVGNTFIKKIKFNFSLVSFFSVCFRDKKINIKGIFFRGKKKKALKWRRRMKKEYLRRQKTHLKEFLCFSFRVFPEK